MLLVLHQLLFLGLSSLLSVYPFISGQGANYTVSFGRFTFAEKGLVFV